MTTVLFCSSCALLNTGSRELTTDDSISTSSITTVITDETNAKTKEADSKNNDIANTLVPSEGPATIAYNPEVTSIISTSKYIFCFM